MPELRIVFVPHPLATQTPEEIDAAVEAALDEIVNALVQA
jgi:hypothetical protein